MAGGQGDKSLKASKLDCKNLPPSERKGVEFEGRGFCNIRERTRQGSRRPLDF